MTTIRDRATATIYGRDRYAFFDNELLLALNAHNVSAWPNVAGVYFVRSGDYIKIGFSGESIRARLQNLQTGNPQLLSLLGYVANATTELERSLHERFDHLRAPAGREWFSITAELLDVVFDLSRDGAWR